MIDVENTSWYKKPETFINNDLQYQSWFDTCDSINNSFKKGYIDFFTKILTEDIYKHLGDPREKTSFEIGFGGGRLINAASKVFKKSIGVDILNDKCIEKTKSFLSNDNITLLNYKNINEKVKDNSIDFTYSFIVFQHFTKIKYFFDYIDFLSVKMKKNSVGNIYFTFNHFNNEDFYFDNNFKNRDCSMFYNPIFIKKHLEEKGFKIFDMQMSTKSPWSEAPSRQFYTKFIKL